MDANSPPGFGRERHHSTKSLLTPTGVQIASSSSPAATDGYNDDTLLAASLNDRGLELVINWFTSAVYTISYDNYTLSLAQTFIPKQALEHGFLMHGILAISALHLAHPKSGEDQKDYIRVATAHHNEGLAMYRSELQNITTFNYSACIAFSNITMMCSFALSRPPKPTKSLSVVHDLGQIFLLAKGWHEIVQVAERLDDIQPMNVTPMIKESSEIYGDMRLAVDRLRELNSTIGQVEGHQNTELYNSVIDSLKLVFGAVGGELGILA